MSNVRQMLLHAFEVTPDIVAIMGVEAGFSFRYLDANPSAFRLGGIHESYLNKTVAEVHPHDYASKLTGYYEMAVRTGKPVEFDDIPENIKHITNHAVATPIIDNGVCTHVLVIARNVSKQRTMANKLAEAEERHQSEQKRLYQELQLREQQYRLIAEHVTDLICLMNPDGIVQYASPSYQHVLGVNPAWYVGRQGRVIVHPEDRDNLLSQFALAKATRKPTVVEYRKGGVEEGNYIYVESTLIPIFGEDGQISHMMAVSHDISQRVTHERELRTMAFTDSLTQLPNRRDFRHQINEIIQFRKDGASHALLFLDCDNFKAVNDLHGHQFGDRFLVELATRVRNCIRGNDIVFRFAGDEFCILLKDATKAEAQGIAERIIDIVRLPVNIGDAIVHATASIGISLFPQDAVDANTLIEMADQAMYAAKDGGKGRYIFYDAVSDQASVRSE